MWATQHDAASLFNYCSMAVAAITGTSSMTSSTTQCISAKVDTLGRAGVTFSCREIEYAGMVISVDDQYVYSYPFHMLRFMINILLWLSLLFSSLFPLFFDLQPTEQFVFKICDAPELGFDLSEMEVDMAALDDACGAGTSEMDYTVEDYLSTIEDAVELLEGFVGLSIPAEETAGVCEVRGGGGSWPCEAC